MTIYLSIDSFLFIIIVSFSLLGSFIVSINRRCDLKIQIGYFFVGFIERFLPPGALQWGWWTPPANVGRTCRAPRTKDFARRTRIFRFRCPGRFPFSSLQSDQGIY